MSLVNCLTAQSTSSVLRCGLIIFDAPLLPKVTPRDTEAQNVHLSSSSIHQSRGSQQIAPRFTPFRREMKWRGSKSDGYSLKSSEFHSRDPRGGRGRHCLAMDAGDDVEISFVRAGLAFTSQSREETDFHSPELQSFKEFILFLCNY